ncbi:methyltransferase family protein [Leucobacter komagatae]|uniref:Methyltransferase family protein n=1 Tax=Leucobacter komagatae TaxID=55969 RepID=A0A542Y9M4_9MICO|nr:methyltransferase family protein [Leucobacter komagatae]
MTTSGASDSWFWELVAPVYELMWSGPVTEQLRWEVARALAGADSVADIGCGTGFMVDGLVASGVSVVGVDASKNMLRRALALGRVSSAVHCTATQVPLDSASVDAVVMTNLLHAHPEPQDVLQEAIRLLRPGGTLVLSWPADGISPARMYGIDRAHGRGIVASLAAHCARTAVGIIATFTAVGRGRRTGRGAGLQRLAQSSGLTAGAGPRVIAGCQEFLVLQHA